MTPFSRMQIGRDKGNYICLSTYSDEDDMQLAIDWVKQRVQQSYMPTDRITIRNNKEHKTVYAQVREYED